MNARSRPAHPEYPPAGGTQKGKPVRDRIDSNDLLTPTEVAELFRVNPKTVTRWAKSGKISAIRTLGGHRRFSATEIMRHLDEQVVEA